MNIWKIQTEIQFFEQILKISSEDVEEKITEIEKKNYYGEAIYIPKKKGKRKIYKIDKSNALYEMQKRLNKNFLNNIMISDVSYGFKKNTNYIEFLLPHTNFYKKNNYLKLDIKNFFESIEREEIENSFKYYVDDAVGYENKIRILRILTEIVTYNDSLIQGAPTSPEVSNIVFRSLDIRIQRYCRRYSVTYSRYADDLLFSSEGVEFYSDRFISGISRILASKKLFINFEKIIRCKKYISLGGFVVDDTIRLSRKKISNINRVLFYIDSHTPIGDSEWFDAMNAEFKEQIESEDLKFDGVYSLSNYLAGNRAFLISILKYSNNQNYIERANKIIARIENKINEMLK